MILYDCAIFIGGLIALPKWLLQKKYKGSLKERLGIILPPSKEGSPRIWMHMVSMGETKAMIPIYQQLKKKHPHAVFYFSHTTQAGQLEAKKHFAGTFFFLPLDLSWLMNRLSKKIRPGLLILSESDFWFNLAQSVKKRGGKVILLNGKVSEKSALRYAKAPFYSKKLFQNFDHLCIQNAEYAQRFRSLNILPEKLSITGNLKLANPVNGLSEQEKALWMKKLDLELSDHIITIGSTHEGEETLLLKHMPKASKILLVPRHPERFKSVKQRFEGGNVRVVDQMGVLLICYQLSNYALVGGSFLPGVGGHNVFEPIQCGKPVIFGLHMEKQKELVHIVLDNNAGLQCSAEELPKALNQIESLKDKALVLSKRGGKEMIEPSIVQVEKLLLS